jgi:replicative DNA helicase
MEQFVLGVLLLSGSPEQVLEARDNLPADAFMPHTHFREIYDTLCEMAERGDSINAVMLSSRLTERDSKVTPADIAAIYDGVPRFSNGSLQSEFKTLRDLATRRAALRHANGVIIEAQNRDCDVDALVGRAHTMAEDLDASRAKN